MFKNLTIRQASLAISFVIWLIHMSLICIVFCLFLHFTIEFLPLLIYGVISLTVGYFIIQFILAKFVFRKIKLIYKVISGSKDSLENVKELENLNSTLEEVQTQVEEWAVAREREISTLKSLENYRKKFVGDISHELKTPLFSIQGYLHTLLDGGMYDEEINRKYLERAASNAERLQLIVEDLEMINKLESESEKLNIKKFDLKELVLEVFRDLEILTKESSIAMIVKPGADKAFTVLADRDKIRQVLINLLSNSIKYSNEGGKTKVSFYDLDEVVLTEVSDNGIGMEEVHLKHVFDRFYRADKSRARNIGGSGLGLSIVKHIIEAHKQKITVRSTPDAGSTFGFTLKKIT